MIKFKRESSGHPDYILLRGEMDKTYSVGEAINEIVAKNPKNTGLIHVCGWSIRFREGSLVDNIYPYIKDFVVTDIKGIDSWGQLRLTMEVDTKGNDKHKSASKSVDICKVLDEMGQEIIPFIRKYENILGKPISSLTYTPEMSTSIESDFIGDEMWVKIKI